jgi:hypothetical protein
MVSADWAVQECQRRLGVVREEGLTRTCVLRRRIELNSSSVWTKSSPAPVRSPGVYCARRARRARCQGAIVLDVGERNP